MSALTDEEEADLIFRVDDGAEFLDAVLPGWRQRIDLDRLTLAGRVWGRSGEYCGCIIQQTVGDYIPSALALTASVWRSQDAESLGFDIPSECKAQLGRSASELMALRAAAWEVLQRRWEEQILYPGQL